MKPTDRPWDITQIESCAHILNDDGDRCRKCGIPALALAEHFSPKRRAPAEPRWRPCSELPRSAGVFRLRLADTKAESNRRYVVEDGKWIEQANPDYDQDDHIRRLCEWLDESAQSQREAAPGDSAVAVSHSWRSAVTEPPVAAPTRDILVAMKRDFYRLYGYGRRFGL
jgi:hypothetical protein